MLDSASDSALDNASDTASDSASGWSKTYVVNGGARFKGKDTAPIWIKSTSGGGGWVLMQYAFDWSFAYLNHPVSKQMLGTRIRYAPHEAR